MLNDGYIPSSCDNEKTFSDGTPINLFLNNEIKILKNNIELESITNKEFTEKRGNNALF